VRRRPALLMLLVPLMVALAATGPLGASLLAALITRQAKQSAPGL
jgi:hypothetical protein